MPEPRSHHDTTLAIYTVDVLIPGEDPGPHNFLRREHVSLETARDFAHRWQQPCTITDERTGERGKVLPSGMIRWNGRKR